MLTAARCNMTPSLYTQKFLCSTVICSTSVVSQKKGEKSICTVKVDKKTTIFFFFVPDEHEVWIQDFGLKMLSKKYYKK